MSTLPAVSPGLPTLGPPVPSLEALVDRLDGRFELIDGSLRERFMGAESSLVASRINRIIGNFSDDKGLGRVFGADCGYQVFGGTPKRTRFPDCSFVARGRLPNDAVPKGFMTIAPDLAIEVVSTNDTAEEVEAKRIDFLAAGTRLFWIVYPESRTVHVYRQHGAMSVLVEANEIDGEDVLPGFTCGVAKFFQDLGSTSNP